MTHPEKPSTRPLLRLAGADAERVFTRLGDETYAVSNAVVLVGNRIHRDHGGDVRRGTWPPEPALVAALQAALPEHADDYAGASLAWALVHFGARDAATLAMLHPWDRAMFDWQARGLDAARVSALLVRAGFDAPSPASCARIDGWIADPLRAMGAAWSLIAALFEERFVYAGLEDPGGRGEPAHAELLVALARQVEPPLELQDCAERPFEEDDEDSRRIVDYRAGDEARTFEITVAGCVDAWAVLAEFDALAARCGRPERAFWFAAPRGESSLFAYLLVADPARLQPLRDALGLPFTDRADTPAWSAAAAGLA